MLVKLYTTYCFVFVSVFGAISSLTLLPTTFGTRINITHDCYVYYLPTIDTYIYVPHSGKCMFEEDFCSAALGWFWI